MNKNIDLTKILKYCPEGTKFYCTICGYVTVKVIETDPLYPIVAYGKYSSLESPSQLCRLSRFGIYDENFDGECILFPSKEMRDWSKFTAPWYKKKFDPKTLKVFDKILVRDSHKEDWSAAFFSHIAYDLSEYDLNDCAEKLDFIICTTGSTDFSYCIPFNDDTKSLVGTTKEAPKYYRYWEK